MKFSSILTVTLLIVAAAPAAAAEWTIVTGHVREVTGARLPSAPNTQVVVAAVDESGRIVARQESDDTFRLQLPAGHTYSLLFTGEGETVATLVWGDEVTSFHAKTGSIDLGWVGINPTTHRCFALREIDLRSAPTDTVVASEESP